MTDVERTRILDVACLSPFDDAVGLARSIALGRWDSPLPGEPSRRFVRIALREVRSGCEHVHHG